MDGKRAVRFMNFSNFLKNRKSTLIPLVLILGLFLIYFSIDFWTPTTLRPPKTPQVFAGTGENVSGWAWSENIGWISFNNISGGGAVNYGVNLDTSTGLFSGYAWSENIGWIYFAPAGPYPASPNYSACLDLPGITTEPCNGIGDYMVSGWARALTYGGGWDGWINLRGTTYGVWIDATPNPAEFRGWAWTDMIIGWISFNCKEGGYNEGTGAIYDICSTSNYKVMVNLLAGPNAPPTVTNAIIDGTAYCNISPGVGLIGFKWTYNDSDGNFQSQYHLQIAFDSSFSDAALVVDSINDQTVAAGQDGTSAVQVRESLTPDKADLEVAYANTYYWRIKARDSQGNWSTGWVSGPSFITPSHAYPWIDFTWLPQSPNVEELTQFTDQSIVYGGATKFAWSWSFPLDWQFETGYNSSSQNPLGKFTTIGDKIVFLTATDSDGFFCAQSKTITSQLPLPEWKEIAPF